MDLWFVLATLGNSARSYLRILISVPGKQENLTEHKQYIFPKEGVYKDGFGYLFYEVKKKC